MRADDFGRDAFRFTGTTVNVATSTTTAKNATALDSGAYWFTCTSDTYIRQGAAAVSATANDALVFSGERLLIRVTGTDDDYVAGILSTGSAVMSFTPVQQ